jgi:arylformamidase
MFDNSWIDVSVDLCSMLPTWPGDPTLNISKFADIDKGKVCNVTQLSMSAHTGTHMDAPKHFINNGKTMSDWTLESTTGPVKVFETGDKEFITVDEIKKFDIQKGDRIIFKTPNSSYEWFEKPFNENFVCFSNEAAEYIAQKQIMTVGVDYLSVGGMKNGKEVHNFILGAGIWIIEGLYLKDIKPGNYNLLCMPIKLKGADGAPSRAFMKSIN